MNKINFIFILLLNLIFSQNTYADLIKYPSFEINNFPSEVHGGVRATWDIAQDDDGIMYFANTGGILIYDGSNWKTISIKENPIIRSITKNHKNNILVSFSRSFGEITWNKEGKIIYNQISEIPASSPYGITELSKNNEYLITQFKYLNLFVDGKLETIIKKKLKFDHVSQIGSNVYLSIRGKGLFLYKDRKLNIIKGTEVFKDRKQSVIKVFENKGGLILVTRQSGIFSLINGNLTKFNINNDLFNDTTLFNGLKLKDGRYAIGSTNGLFVFDSDIDLKIHIGTDTGLQDNFIRSLYEDYQGNIWLGLNDGISKVKLTSGITMFEKKSAKINSIVNYAEKFNDELFLATSTGIRKSKKDHENLRQIFIPVANDKLRAQTWSMLNFKDKKLFVGSRWGLSLINNQNEFEQLLDHKKTGSIYTMIKSQIFKDHIFLGGNKGLGLFDIKNPDQIIRFPKLPVKIIWQGLFENKKTNEVWVRELYKGIYRIKFLENSINKISYEVTKFTNNDGIPNSTYRNTNFFKFNDETLLSSPQGVYKLNKIQNKFEIDNRFSKVPDFRNKLLEAIIQLPNNKKYVVFSENKNNKRLVSLYKFNKNFEFEKLPIDENLLRKFSRIKLFTYDNKIILTGSAGILIIPKNLNFNKSNAKSLVRKITVNNSNIFNGTPQTNFLNKKYIIKDKFEHSENQFNFKIALTDYVNEQKNKYRYKLEGLDENFSNYTKSKEIKYTNLSPGNYKLIIEGKNSQAEDILPYEYSFTIKPPWWETTYFYVGEILFFILLLLITAFSKTSTRGQKFATAMTFVVIIVFFEFLNMFIDPLLIKLTGGIPVFDLLSKVALGLLLQPVERLASRLLDMFSDFVGKKTIAR